MLTREELENSLFANKHELKMEVCYRGRTKGAIEHENKILDSHLSAIDEIERLKAELAKAKAENNVRDDALTCIADLIKYVHKKQPQSNTTGNLIPRQEPQTGDRGIKA